MIEDGGQRFGRREVEVTPTAPPSLARPLHSLRQVMIVARRRLSRAGVMGNGNDQPQRRTQEILEAFDRERAEAHELSRRHCERVRASLEHDRQFTSTPSRRKT